MTVSPEVILQNLCKDFAKTEILSVLFGVLISIVSILQEFANKYIPTSLSSMFLVLVYISIAYAISTVGSKVLKIGVIVGWTIFTVLLILPYIR